MLKMYEIREMIKLIDQSNLQEFELKGDDVRIKIKRQGAPTSTAAPVMTQIPVIKEAKPVPVVKPAAPVVKTVAEIPSKPAPSAPSVSIDETLHKITSPMVGTFYCAPAVDAPPFVKPGDQVNQSTIVCIVEAMKLFNEIEAETQGEIVQVLVENGQLVEYGQPLFLVRPQS